MSDNGTGQSLSYYEKIAVEMNIRKGPDKLTFLSVAWDNVDEWFYNTIELTLPSISLAESQNIVTLSTLQVVCVAMPKTTAFSNSKNVWK